MASPSAAANGPCRSCSRSRSSRRRSRDPHVRSSTSPLQQQADTLFAEGRELLEKGKFPEACAKLARSAELSAAVGTLTNLGYCNEQIGKLRSAMNAYAEAETLATAVGDTKRAAFARERLAAVEPKAPKLVLRLVAAGGAGPHAQAQRRADAQDGSRSPDPRRPPGLRHRGRGSRVRDVEGRGRRAR